MNERESMGKAALSLGADHVPHLSLDTEVKSKSQPSPEGLSVIHIFGWTPWLPKLEI
jgi:hypothetical protein